MNPDTAPIAEVEAYLLERGMDILGRSIDAAIACLPPGWYWECEAGAWNAWPEQGPVVGMMVSSERSREPILARDELLRLAAKAWKKVEGECA